MDIKFFGGSNALFDSLVAVIVSLCLYIFRGLRNDVRGQGEEIKENADRLSHIEGFLQAQTGAFQCMVKRLGNKS